MSVDLWRKQGMFYRYSAGYSSVFALSPRNGHQFQLSLPGLEYVETARRMSLMIDFSHMFISASTLPSSPEKRYQFTLKANEAKSWDFNFEGRAAWTPSFIPDPPQRFTLPITVSAESADLEHLYIGGTLCYDLCLGDLDPQSDEPAMVRRLFAETYQENTGEPAPEWVTDLLPVSSPWPEMFFTNVGQLVISQTEFEEVMTEAVIAVPDDAYAWDNIADSLLLPYSSPPTQQQLSDLAVRYALVLYWYYNDLPAQQFPIAGAESIFDDIF